jgi:glycosyltransferase involved in cell wall biosynthesis
MPSAADLEVSVIVPVRNGAKSLPPLLRSLDEQTLAGERYEVIVVDNDSSDGTAEVAASHGACVVQEPIANRSRARNRGAEAARTRLYAFTDADCVAHPGWLETLLGCAHEAPLMAGEVRLKVSDEPNAIERFEQRWRFAQEGWVKQAGWAATANLLVHAEAFDAISGFDPSWRHIGEDADFCLRARAAGYGLDYCAGAIVEHEGESELRPMLRRCFLHGYSVNQAFYRLGLGDRAWRHPSKALIGDGALRDIGHRPDAFDSGEWRRMARLARLGYAARVAGSAWAEMRRAR